MRPFAFTLLCVASLFLHTASASPELATREITALLNAVEKSACQFERNGSLHSGLDAAEHLQKKWQRIKTHVNSAEAFIEKVASVSSQSGKPYAIHCTNSAQAASAWFMVQLSDLRTDVATKH